MLCNTPVSTFCSSLHPSRDIYVASTYCQFWICCNTQGYLTMSLTLLQIFTQESNCCTVWCFYFQFLKSLDTVFPSGCRTAPIFHILANTCYFVWFLFILSFLMNTRWIYIVLLTCISLIITNVDRIFRCVLPIWMSALRNVYCIFTPLFFQFMQMWSFHTIYV